MSGSIPEFFDRGGSITIVRDDDVLGMRHCNIRIDDPGLDGTDAAHPAWWRGHDVAAQHARTLQQRINDACRLAHALLPGDAAATLIRTLRPAVKSTAEGTDD